MLWTRVSVAAGETVPVRWTVATDPALADPVAGGVADAAPGGDHTVHVAVAGLRPATTYWYGFGVGGERSPVGRTRTLPAARTARLERLRLGVVCCAHYATGYFNAYARLAERDVDLVVHLGDYIYEAEAKHEKWTRFHRPRGRCLTLPDYRARHAQYKTDPDLQALHARHPMVAVWDDHELAGNAWWDGAAGHDPHNDGDWVRRRAAAVRAYREWVPQACPTPPIRSGSGARCRSGRWPTWCCSTPAWPAGSSRPPAGGRWSASGDGTGRCSGPSNGRGWRRRSGRDRRMPTRAVGAGGQPGGGGADPSAGRRRRRRAAPRGGRRRADRELGAVGRLSRGAGAAAAAAGSTAAGAALVLSGDLHSSWVSRLAADDGRGAPVAAEFTVPAVSAPTFARALAPKVRGARSVLEWAIRRANPHIAWVDTATHGYVLLDVTAERIEGQWWHVDRVGKRTEDERLAATWSVRRGDPRPRAG